MVRLTSQQRVGAILGAADGLTIVVALIFGHNPVIFQSALFAGIGEFVGMAAALWLTDRSQTLAALLCGLATLLACVLPAIPFAIFSGALAFGLSCCVALMIGAIVCWMRPERGPIAIFETYGVLGAAATLCYLVSFLFH